MCVSVLFCSPQVLVMITSTLYTRRTTAICLVPTTSRSFPIGPHISQHWCHSCALTAYPAALCVYHILEKKHPPPPPLQAFLLTFCWFPPAVYLLSWLLKPRNRRGGADREYCSVSQRSRRSSSLLSMLRWRSCFKPSFTSVTITWVHYGSVPQTHWNDTKLTPQLTE